jgi:hypothetical protein
MKKQPLRSMFFLLLSLAACNLQNAPTLASPEEFATLQKYQSER